MTQIKPPSPQASKNEYIKEFNPFDLKITRGEKIFYTMYGFFSRTMDFKYKMKQVKWFFQRAKRGWADCDTWGLCSYYSDVVYQSIKYFNEKKHGHPSNVSSFEEWTNILDKIVKGFEAAKTQDEIELPKEKMSSDEYATFYRAEWDRLEKIRLEGMNLFVEYFHALWD